MFTGRTSLTEPGLSDPGRERRSSNPDAGAGPAYTRGPDLAVALDVQESREADRGIDRAGMARQFDYRGPAAALLGLSISNGSGDSLKVSLRWGTQPEGAPDANWWRPRA